jgi:hypothetical protein
MKFHENPINSSAFTNNKIDGHGRTDSHITAIDVSEKP